VWVGAWRTDRLAAIDSTANRAVPRLRPPVSGGTADMARSGDTLWVATRAREVLRLDARSGRPLAAPVPLTMDPSALAVRGSDVWVGQELDSGAAQIVRIDARTGAVEASVQAGANIGGIVYARGRIWTLHGEPNHLVERDPQTLAQIKHIPVPGVTVGGLAAGAGALWATLPDQDQLLRYQPRTGNRATVSVVARPIGVTVQGRRVWVAASGSSTVQRFTTGDLVSVGEPIRVPLNPLAIAISGEAIWVTCVGDNVIARVEAPS
jgi:hypothetical protein